MGQPLTITARTTTMGTEYSWVTRTRSRSTTTKPTGSCTASLFTRRMEVYSITTRQRTTLHLTSTGMEVGQTSSPRISVGPRLPRRRHGTASSVELMSDLPGGWNKKQNGGKHYEYG